MLNTNTHRVTELEDVEAHINGNHVPRWLNTRAEVRQVAAHAGLTYQGRHEEHPSAAEAATDIGANDTKDADTPDPLLRSYGWTIAIVTLVWVCFVVWAAREVIARMG